MSNLIAPASLIFINNDLTQNVQDVFSRQFFLTQILDKQTFDGYVAADGYYVDKLHLLGERIMVMFDLSDQLNRDLADIVLFASNGLVSVLSNKVGPPNITLSIDRCYLTALIELSKHQQLMRCCYGRLSNSQWYFMQFGNIRGTSFNPHILDPICTRNVEPVDQ